MEKIMMSRADHKKKWPIARSPLLQNVIVSEKNRSEKIDDITRRAIYYRNLFSSSSDLVSMLSRGFHKL